MRRRTKIILGLLLLIVLVGGIGVVSAMTWTPASAGQPALVQEGPVNWDVIASGGTTMSSSSFILLSTTGQPVAGPSSGTDHTLLSGYWQAFVDKVLLPIIFG